MDLGLGVVMGEALGVVGGGCAHCGHIDRSSWQSNSSIEHMQALQATSICRAAWTARRH